MPTSAPRFKGKLKREIAAEAFEKIGKDATVQQVDEYFRKHYGLPFCERSMYAVAKRVANGKPRPMIRRYQRVSEKRADIVGVIARLKQLAYDAGGWDELEELIKVMRV